MRAHADHVHRAGHDDADARAGKMGGKEAAWRPEQFRYPVRLFAQPEALLARDKVNLDIFWLKDDALDDPDLLPPPDEVAAEIVESLETALERFRGAAKALGEMPV